MRLFISYAHSDEELVRDAIVEILRAGGHDPWFDHRLKAGHPWKQQLLQAILSSDAFVYALTPKSIASEWCRWEFVQAVKHEKPVIPVLLKPTKLPRVLAAIQHVDFINGATGVSVARLMSSLREAATVPLDTIPAVPDTPSGNPARAPYRTGELPSSSYLPPCPVISLTNVETAHELAIIRGYRGDIYAVSFSPDSKQLAAASRDKTLRLWDVATQEEIATLEGHDDTAYALTFSPDGKMLASASDDTTVRLWDMEEHRELAVLRGHGDCINALAFSPDGKLLASASDDTTVRLWDVETFRSLNTLTGHNERVKAVSFSPDGKLLATAARSILLWDVTYWRHYPPLKGHIDFVSAATFSPDGETFAAASSSRVWMWETDVSLVGREPALGTLRGQGHQIEAIAYSPSGDIMATASDGGSVWLWNTHTLRSTVKLEEHKNSVWSVAFSPDGTLLATASADETIRIWGCPQ